MSVNVYAGEYYVSESWTNVSKCLCQWIPRSVTAYVSEYLDQWLLMPVNT